MRLGATYKENTLKLFLGITMVSWAIIREHSKLKICAVASKSALPKYNPHY